MRNNLRNLLSVPVLAIAATAFTTTNVDAQCPGGCFGYPTPSRPAFRTFAPAVQFQRVEIAPVHTFVQPEIIIAPQQFTSAPLQQTFVSQPAIVESGIVNVPQNFPQPVYPGLPVGAYNVHPVLPTQSILPTQLALPMQPGLPGQQTFSVETDTKVIPPVTKPMDADSATDGMEENVEEGQIEGEIISPVDEAPEAPSVMQQDNASDMPLIAARGLEAEKAAMEKAEMEKAAKEKAEMEKAAKEKAEMEKAAMEKAAMEKAEMEKAAKKKSAKEKADKKVLTKEERIANLENSLKRQKKRAEQVSKRNLNSKLEELRAADASDAAIEAAKLESADALKVKLAEIENRIQARIDQLKN